MYSPFPVFVIDDDRVTRRLLEHALVSHGLSVVGFLSAEEFLAAAPKHQHRACCLIVDVQMPGIGGLGLQEILNRDGVLVPVVFFSVVTDINIVVQAMKGGAVDFVPKTISWDRFMPRVERAIEIFERRSEQRAEEAKYHAKLQTLTPQERRVYELLIAGKSSKEVGRDLQICIPTVARHRCGIFKKFGARNVVELARQAWRFEGSRGSHNSGAAPSPHIPFSASSIAAMPTY